MLDFFFAETLTPCRFATSPKGEMPEPASQNPGGSVARVFQTHPTLRHGADAPCYSRLLLPRAKSNPTVILVCDRKLLDDADISYQGEFLGYTLYNIDDADDGQDKDDGVQNPGHGRRKSSDKPAYDTTDEKD